MEPGCRGFARMQASYEIYVIGSHYAEKGWSGTGLARDRRPVAVPSADRQAQL